MFGEVSIPGPRDTWGLKIKDWTDNRDGHAFNARALKATIRKSETALAADHDRRDYGQREIKNVRAGNVPAHVCA